MATDTKTIGAAGDAAGMLFGMPPGVISGITSLLGGMGEQSANAETAMQNRNLAKSKYEAQKRAYQNVISTGRGDLESGENAFNNVSSMAPPELQQMKTDILQGNAEGLNQARDTENAELAQQGVRGPQAAILANRGIGAMGIQANRDVNQLLGENSENRQNQRMAYNAAKAQMGQRGSYTLPNF